MPAKRRTSKSSGRKTKAAPQKNKLTRDLIGLALIALGIFMLVSVFFADLTGAFGLAVRDVIFGLFGVVAYVVPFLMVVIGWLVMISWKANVHGGKVGTVVALVVLCIALVHLIYDGGIRQGLVDKPGFGAYVEMAFLYGIQKGGGAGALGGALTWPLTEFLGGVGSIILVIAALLGCGALLTRFSLGDAGRKVTEAAYGAATGAIQQARARREQMPQPQEDWEEPEPAVEQDPDDWERDSFLSEEEAVSISWRAPEDERIAPPPRRDFPGNPMVSRPRPRRLPNEHIQRPKGKRRPEPEVIDLLTGQRVGSWSAEPVTVPLAPPEDDALLYDTATQDGELGFGDPMGVPVETEEPLMQASTIERDELDGDVEMDGIGLPTHEIPAEDETPLDLPPVEDGQDRADEAIQAVNALPQEPPQPPPPPPYQKPQLDLLSAPPNTEAADRRARREQEERAALLIKTLKSFGIDSTVVGISRGPALTRYELKPAAGVKVSRITGLADDIALNMAAAGVRIEAPIPGKAAIGIEVPNLEVVPVTLREVLMSEEFQRHPSRLAMALGMDITGKPVVGDLADMPHVLIAGATGSGKSVCINSMVTSILYKASPEEVKLIMIDPKVVELSVYNGIPHLLIPVVTDPKKAAGALNWAVQEMESRYKKFAATNCRDLKGYNQYAKQNGLEPLYQLVVIVDELADLMIVASREVEEYINRLAQLARAAGIHLVIATQRPSVNVITGVIKANIPSRIAFAVASQVDSRTILDIAGAEKLLGRGDMLYFPRGSGKPRRVQGCLITDGEVQRVVEVVKRSNREADYNPDILESLEKIGAPEAADPGMEPEGGGADDLLQQAIELALDTGQISVSMLQRRFKIGYARAGRLIDDMEQRGIVSGYGGSKAREVLMTRDEYNRLYIQG